MIAGSARGGRSCSPRFIAPAGVREVVDGTHTTDVAGCGGRLASVGRAGRRGRGDPRAVLRERAGPTDGRVSPPGALARPGPARPRRRAIADRAQWRSGHAHRGGRLAAGPRGRARLDQRLRRRPLGTQWSEERVCGGDGPEAGRDDGRPVLRGLPGRDGPGARREARARRRLVRRRRGQGGEGRPEPADARGSRRKTRSTRS